VTFTPVVSAKKRFAYCTLSEMAADLGDIGIRDDVLARFIIPATQYLLNEIGQFLPIYETRVFSGNSKADLVINPLLTLESVTNDTTPVLAGSYILEPTTRMWQYGPYVKISLDLQNATGAFWIPKKDAVQISGTWGLYEQIKTTGATIKTTQGAADATLEVSDAGKVSSGMLLLVESEMQFVTGFSDPAAAVTSLSVTCDNQTESLTVASTANIHVGEIIRIDFERMLVLDKTSTKINVARGWAGTTKTAHSSSADIDVYKVFTVDRAVNGSAAAAHAATTAIQRYIMPEDVNYLCRQIATLMMKKSQTGYAGRSGNSETGETFYNFEFPRDVIERVKRNYAIPHMR